MTQFDFNEKYRQRTLRLSSRVIDWYGRLDQPSEAMEIMSRQLIRSVTSTASGFRAACRSRTPPERSEKLSTVVESSDQTLFWLELLKNAELIDQATFDSMYEEALAILKVMATHRKNMMNL
ncbi:MAG: four helix bundle protein [Saprospiraceae bacterium]|nr:four helix bundle protein [Lewinella sp.]